MILIKNHIEYTVQLNINQTLFDLNCGGRYIHRDGFECAGSRDICASRKLLNIEWGPDDRETINLTFPNPDVVTAGRQQPCDQHTVHTSKASMRSVGHQVGENQSRATITTMPAGVDGTQARRQKTEVERTRVDGIGM